MNKVSLVFNPKGMHKDVLEEIDLSTVTVKLGTSFACELDEFILWIEGRIKKLENLTRLQAKALEEVGEQTVRVPLKSLDQLKNYATQKSK